ncbi:hypothetical protein AX15_001715 [Amanita polypyramis BW_CC]|nr:hypothetical protein AX15_001715 [Amanita polypyramis BW_CC]
MPLISNELQLVTILALCLAALAVIHRRCGSSSGPPLPPGPLKHFFCHSNIPTNSSYIQFEEWTKQYGPVFALRYCFQTVIVIGRVQAAIDIMEKEGAVLADRPRNIPAEVLSGGMRLLLMSAGERLKKMRRALHAYLQPKTIASYGPILMQRTKQHVLGILDNPSSHQDHAKHFAASVVMALAYGSVPERHDDPDIVAVNVCLRRLGVNLLPGKWKVNIFPFLKYVPGYFDELHEGHAKELALFQRKVREVREKLARGEDARCFSRYLLEKQDELGLSDNELAYLAGSMFGAGTETTSSSISLCIMVAAIHSDAQHKVQEELDRVIGREQAPKLTDLDALPQLHAFVLEVLRWRPIAANGFGFPHRTTKQITWNNYCIPKGTIVLGSVWSIGRDPQYFPRPEAFDPQRWINDNGKINEDLKNFSFGFGRRVCPGQHVANASVLLNTALLLWAFNIREDPSSPLDSMALRASFIAGPLPFNVNFEPRAAATADGIRELLTDYAL